MPSQFQNALQALRLKNTALFNQKYGMEQKGRLQKRTPSQFELASEALRSKSPISFNEQYSVSMRGGKRRKTRKSKKARRVTRRRR